MHAALDRRPRRARSRRRRRYRDHRPATRGGCAALRIGDCTRCARRSKLCRPTNANSCWTGITGRAHAASGAATPLSRSTCVSPASRTYGMLPRGARRQLPAAPATAPLPRASSRRPSATSLQRALALYQPGVAHRGACANGFWACATRRVSVLAAAHPRCATSSTTARSTPPSWPTRAATSESALPPLPRPHRAAGARRLTSAGYGLMRQESRFVVPGAPASAPGPHGDARHPASGWRIGSASPATTSACSPTRDQRVGHQRHASHPGG